MSHRPTKEELDEQFELFMKESVSDDSVDVGGSDKQSSAQSSHSPVKKAPVSWWEDDEHMDRGARTAQTAKSRFIKAKKSQPENDNVDAEPFHKPLPKPRSKTQDKPVPSDDTCKEAVLEVPQRHRSPCDDSDSQSSPTHETLKCKSGARSPDETHSHDAPSANSPPQKDSGDGLLGSGRTFRKSLRKSQSIVEEEEDPGDAGWKIQDPVLVPAANTASMGLDTLEEEEEKARFFAQLEAGASAAVDYSKLNRALDSTLSTISTNLRKSEDAVDDDPRKVTDTPAFTGSPHYSEDFEEEEKGKEPLEEASQGTPILTKVALYDSLEETKGGEDRTKDTAESQDRGQVYVQSGGSDMEALHEAYRQIHVVEDSDDHDRHRLSAGGMGKVNRPASPSSPPHHTRQSLQPSSTAESELPTAEELMRPIRPESDHIRGFTLQPVSAEGLDQQKMPHLEKTFLDVTSPASQRRGKAEPVSGIKGAGSSPDPPDRNLTWSIRQEVERLMLDQNKYTSCQAGKAKKQPPPHGSTVSPRPGPSYLRKPTVAPVRGGRVGGRAAVTSGPSGLSRAAATARSQSSVCRPLQQPQSTKRPKKDDCTELGVKESSDLVASVQSLVSVLQLQVDTSSRQDAADTQEARHQLPQDRRQEDGAVVEELRNQLAHKEKELQVVREGAEELHSLRQQNYVLQSKLRSAEEVSQKKRYDDSTESADTRLQQMNQEITEQETLIKGYQQENEKLYLQMKAQQAKSKSNEDAMFKENQRLLNELAFTREQLNKACRPVGNVCLLDHTQRITDLLAQINTFQRNGDKLSEDIHRLKQEKQALEVDLQLEKRERERAKAQATSASGEKSFEMRVLEDKHREEVATLKKKMQWFTENQELLDRDGGRLKAATAEIHQLQEQIEKIKVDVGRRSSEQQRKAKEKTADMKKMQDLERQVKELEQILRSRNPNSLPALIYAAATADSQADAAKTPPSSRISALLERRIQRLEAELESHDEEAKHSLRAMEQQFHRIKLRYEQQISELEQQLEQNKQLEAAKSDAGAEPWMSQVRTLEEELQRVKATHQEKEKSLLDQIESLKQQLKQKAHSSPGRHQRQAEAAFGVRIERLNQELSTKTRSIQELSRTVDRLQRERRSMLSVPSARAESRRQPGAARAQSPAAAGGPQGGDETFPAAQCHKTYQPTVFTGSHISEVLQDNEALKQQLELQELQSEQDKGALKADALTAREELCRLQQRCAEQMSSLTAEHLRVLDQLHATHALEHSSSKVAELSNKLNTQEIMLKHLQDQLKELQGAKEALVTSRTREDAVQKQLSRLLEELREAKEAQSPEVKLLCSLERKILDMELRHQHRETELQQVIGGSWLETDQQVEAERWKRVAQDKSRELEAFRLELDSILDILRHLQRQGVVLPPHATSYSHS